MTLSEVKQVVSDHMPDTVWDDERAPVYVGSSADNGVWVAVTFYDAEVARATVRGRGANSAYSEPPERITIDYLRRWLPLACDLVQLEV